MKNFINRAFMAKKKIFAFFAALCVTVCMSAANYGILVNGKTYFAVATEDGAIGITDLQLSGKKRMDVKAFLLGFRHPTSYTTTIGTSKAEMAKAAPKEEE